MQAPWLVPGAVANPGAARAFFDYMRNTGRGSISGIGDSTMNHFSYGWDGGIRNAFQGRIEEFGTGLVGMLSAKPRFWQIGATGRQHYPRWGDSTSVTTFVPTNQVAVPAAFRKLMSWPGGSTPLGSSGPDSLVNASAGMYLASGTVTPGNPANIVVKRYGTLPISGVLNYTLVHATSNAGSGLTKISAHTYTESAGQFAAQGAIIGSAVTVNTSDSGHADGTIAFGRLQLAASDRIGGANSDDSIVFGPHMEQGTTGPGCLLYHYICSANPKGVAFNTMLGFGGKGLRDLASYLPTNGTISVASGVGPTTCTCVNHGLISGQTISVDGATAAAVTVTDANTFTITATVVNGSTWVTTASATSGTITNWTAANPTVATCNAHGLVAGQIVTVVNSTGGSPGTANGTFTVGTVTANTFQVVGLNLSGGAATGGTWTTAAPSMDAATLATYISAVCDQHSVTNGGSGTVRHCFHINSATNDASISYTGLSLGQNPSASNTVAGYVDNMTELRRRLIVAWNATRGANADQTEAWFWWQPTQCISDSPTSPLPATYTTAADHEAWLRVFRAAALNFAAGMYNNFAVDLQKLMSAAEILAGAHLYDPTDPIHPSMSGYDYMAGLAIDALAVPYPVNGGRIVRTLR